MPLAEPHAMAVTYLRHKERIRGMALRRYFERAYEGRGIILLRKGDLRA
jgi:hypothetical protein